MIHRMRPDSGFLGIFLLIWIQLAAAAESPPAVSVETLNAKIQEIEASANLDEATRNNLTELYRKTISYLEAVRSNRESANSFGRSRETAAAQAENIRRQIEINQAEGPVSNVIADVSAQTPLPEIEQLLITEKANLSALEARLAELEGKLANETARPVAVRKRLNEATNRQEQISAELKSPPPASELHSISEARRWMQDAELLALSTEIRMLDEELLSQPMRVALLEAQRDKAAKTTERIRAGVNLLAEMLAGRRRLEAEAAVMQAEQAEREALGKHPLIQSLAAKNSALSKQLTTLAARLEQISGEDDLAGKEARRIADDFSTARQRLQIAGLNQALGLVLQEQRRGLPDLRSFRKESREREQLIAEASLAQIQFNEERRNLRDLDGYLANLLTGLSQEEIVETGEELRNLAANRRELLNKGVETNNAYLSALGELDFARNQLFEAAQTYNNYLAERLLWIRSDSAIDLDTLRAFPLETASLLSPAQWLAVGAALTERATGYPALILAAAVTGLLLWKRRHFRTALRETGKTVGRPSTDRISFTLRALLFSLLLAAPWPLLLATAGWQLGEALDATAFTKAVSTALLLISPALFYLFGFRVLCAPGGVAAIHFRWSQASLKRLRKALLRLTILLPPAGIIALLSATEDTWNLHRGIHRLALIVLLVTLALFLYWLFDPRKGVLEPHMTRNPRGSLARLRYLWLGLSIGVPAVLAGLILYGYVYTAGILTQRLIQTMWFVFGLMLVHQLAVRWLLLTQRRLRFEAALERHRAAAAARETAATAQTEASVPADKISEYVEEPGVDLMAVSDASRELLTMVLVLAGIVGVWLIWSEVLPAFGFLNEVSLWHQTRVVEGEETFEPTTLADIGLAILVLLVTLVATKRFPAVLEITLLQHGSMTSGARYATKTLSSYLIVGIGSIIAFSTIGLDWSKLQWLVAALGVGIGFGLQEIVANFISGLIILFERPIRVGDIVTIGDTDGIVTRIRIRATTILNWDRKELLVPNKEFITGRLLNWSLSDQISRIVIPVGVAYGSDVQKAMALLAEAAEEHAQVLTDPTPFVAFEGFGDNALALTLRAYIGSLEGRINIISQLHEAINRKMNEAGIAIAFPQRDVHLKVSQPLDIRIMRDDSRPDAGYPPSPAGSGPG